MNALRTPFLIAVVVLFGSGPLAPPIQAQEAAPGTLEERVDSLMAEHDSRSSPGGVGGVIREGQIAFAKAYGMADLAHGAPLTEETRFNLGSVSKQFTGFAFALLEKRGQLSLDDPVGKYLPDWPEFEETVTLRHLLTHTSGYREAFGPLFLAGRKLAGREEALEVVRRQPALEFPPGSKFQYSSSAYVLLTEIAERVTDKPFPAWMEENVFNPLGMETALVKGESGEVVPNAASSYADATDGYREPSMDNSWYGSADVYATVEDLAKWLGNFQTGELGGRAVQERMRERFVLSSGDTTRYGLGLRVDDVRGLERVHHSGVKEGFRAQVTYYPKLNGGVVVMANYGGADATGIAREVGEITFRQHMEAKDEELATEESPADADLLEKYAGTYQAEDGRVYVLKVKDGQLFAATPLIDAPLPLAAESKTLFRMPGQDIQIRFHPAPDGTVDQATWERDATILLRRVEPWQPTEEKLEAFAGRYFSPEVEAVYTIRVREGQLVAEHRWIGEIPLSPVAKDVFAGGISVSESFPPFGLQLQFKRDADGVLTSFSASIFRTTGVQFERWDE